MSGRVGVLSTVALVALLISAPIVAGSAQAQQTPAPVAEFAAGTLLFSDDGGTVPEPFAGGTVRFYVLPRVSVGPEIAAISGDNHSHLMFTGNVTFDFVGPSAAGGSPTVTPFLVAGAGLFRTRESFPAGDFTHNEGAFTFGGGVRALVGHRLVLGAEARLGWELHVRLNGIVGLRLGK